MFSGFLKCLDRCLHRFEHRLGMIEGDRVYRWHNEELQFGVRCSACGEVGKVISRGPLFPYGPDDTEWERH